VPRPFASTSKRRPLNKSLGGVRSSPAVRDPRVRIHLFASARTAAGQANLEVEVPPGGLSARALVDRLAADLPALAPILRTSRFVRNGEYLARLSTRVRPGDEFSVHPPYGGG
jgi:molybdopterin converting factor small subunit